jgi:hypothetical protein
MALSSKSERRNEARNEIQRTRLMTYFAFAGDEKSCFSPEQLADY